MVCLVIDMFVEVDLIVVVVDSIVCWWGVDDWFVEIVCGVEKLVLLVFNKMDICSKFRFLLMIEDWYVMDFFDVIVFVSVFDGDGCDVVLDLIFECLLKGELEFDEEFLMLYSECFFVVEWICEKLFEFLCEELLFVIVVVIDDWKELEGGVICIVVMILVEWGGQKKIVIGCWGEMIKKIGIFVWYDFVEYFGGFVYFDLYVKQEVVWCENV